MTDIEEPMASTTELLTICAPSLLGVCIMLLVGCTSLQEDRSVIPHGTPIEHQAIPRELRLKLALPEDASVERYGDDIEDASYRVQFADGTVSVFGPDGSYVGGIL